MKKLKLDIIDKNYPYPKKKGEDVPWARMVLSIVDESGKLIKEIFDIEWHPNLLLEWLLNNKNFILYDIFPNVDQKCNSFSEDKSIAEKISILYGSDNNLDDQKADLLFRYRETHGLRFGLRGLNILDIYMGLNKNKYELSYFGKDESWCYEIDIILFFKSLG